MKDNFAFVAFGKLLAVCIISFMEPAIKIVGWLDGIVADNISSEDIVVSTPGFLCIIKSWDRETVATELALNDVTDNAFGIEATFRPLELAIGCVAVVLALIPIGNRNGNAVRIAE